MDGMRNSYPLAGTQKPKPPARQELEVLIDDTDLRVTRRPGSSGRTVVSFSGVGMKAGGLDEEVQREEFGRSSGEVGEDCLLFVIDKTRSWYNAVYDRVVDVLLAALPSGSEVATLGNSMGGYGALRFAAALPNCRRAIAFSPQFAVHPRHMPRQERRWVQYRDKIQEHRLGHALEADRGSTDYWVFCGIDKLPDIAHFVAFRDLGLPCVHAVCLDRCGHDVAPLLRKAKALSPLLEYLLPPGAGHPEAVDTMLATHGIKVLDAEAFRARREEQQQRRLERLKNPPSPFRRPGKTVARPGPPN